MRSRRLTRGQAAWALFDWANQPYFTLILTFIFGPYFATRIVGEPVAGQALWGYLQALAGVIIAASSPVLGAVADAGGRRKLWCAAFAALGAAGALGLWGAAPGAPVWGVGLLIVLATIGFEVAIVFNNAFLPLIATPGREGWLSGVGWGLGYVGGLVALGVVLLGFYLPEDPWLGLDKAAGEDARMTGPFAALWFVLFSLPFFVLTPEEGKRKVGFTRAAKEGWRRLGETLRHARQFRMVIRFLIARMIYADGLVALFSFGGIFAAGTFGWGTTELGVFGLAILVFSALGSFPGGWADDRYGSRATILASLAGLILATFVILSLSREGIFFGLIPAAGGKGAMTSLPEFVMIAAAAVIGLFAGPVQAASRTLMLRLTPPDMAAEFFGLYAFSGKATAFLAPFLVAVITDFLGTQKAAPFVVILLLATGALLLMRVRPDPRAGKTM